MADIDDDTNDADDRDAIVPCPMCYGDALLMGCLGRLVWYRCEACGVDFNHTTTDEDNG